MIFESSSIWIYIVIIILVLIIVTGILMKKFLRKCLKRMNWMSHDMTQVHQPVALENISNDFDLKQTDLKLEEVSSFDKKDEEKDEKIDLNFEHIASDINTAKESRMSDSPKEKEPQKIDIEFSRVEDVSKIMGTEA